MLRTDEGGKGMFGGGIRTCVILVSAIVLVAPAVGASATPSSELSGELSRAEAEILRQEAAIDESLGDLAGIGARLEEAQQRANASLSRVESLRGETKSLARSLDARKLDAAESRERFKERLAATYKGQQLDGIALLLDKLFGGGPAGEATDTMATRMLASDRESMRLYKQDRVILGDTIRQLERKQEEYDRSWRDHQARVTELELHEAEMEASIRSLRQERGETEAEIEVIHERIEQLEARKKVAPPDPPASSEVDKPPEEEEEARIAREEIAAEPVGELPLTRYRRLYRTAAEDYGFGPDWYVLMAIGKMESNHGENMGPSSAGALGPMQFMPSTWDSAGVDGNGDGVANIMDPEDAIPAAAGYLAAAGAPGDWYAALYAYNGAGWYVQEVLEVAEQYRLLAGDDSVGPYGAAPTRAETSDAYSSPPEPAPAVPDPGTFAAGRAEGDPDPEGNQMAEVRPERTTLPEGESVPENRD